MATKKEPNWEFQCQQYVDFQQLNNDEDDDFFVNIQNGEQANINNDINHPALKSESGSSADRRAQRRSPRLLAAKGLSKTNDAENIPTSSSSNSSRRHKNVSMDTSYLPKRIIRARSSIGKSAAKLPGKRHSSGQIVFGQETPNYPWVEVDNTPNKPLAKKKRSSKDSSQKKQSPLGRLLSHGSSLREKTMVHRMRFGNALAAAVRVPMRAIQSFANVGVESSQEQEDLSEKVDFVSMLRKYNSPKKSAALRQPTIPSPFSFANKPPTRAVATNQAQSFHSVAEQLVAFQNKTPLRFRSTQRGAEPMRPAVRQPSPAPAVVPHTPRLMTRNRQRPVNVPSQSQLEELELEEMKKAQFQARPFNPSIFNESANGVPEIVHKPATIFEPFKLSAGNHPAPRAAEPAPPKFQARPVPRAVLEPPKDLKGLRQFRATSPKSPAFALRDRLRRAETMSRATTATDEPANAPFRRLGSIRGTSSFAGPLLTDSTSTSVSSSWREERGVTKVQPFTFDQQVRDLPERRQRRLQEVLERERREREFHAQPPPDFSSVSLPPRDPRPTTRPAPFDLKVEVRNAAKEDKIKKLLDEEEAKRKAMSTFKAKPCKVIYEAPFCPERTERPLTVVPELQLSTEQRARDRACFDAELRAKEARIAQVVRERAERREQEEAAEEAALRAAAVHRAQPVRHYRNVEVKPCVNSPCNPVSPDLATKKRKRNA